MSKTFAILGAGMQGTSAAYDLAKFANPKSIVMADASLEQAQRSAARVDSLVGRDVCHATTVDALNEEELGALLKPVDVVLSCVPYWMHPKIAPVAIKAGASMVDMGGDTRVSLKTLAYDEEAKAAGVTIVPDTGLAPGLVNNLATYFIESLDEVESIKLYCGGLPQNPKPPFNYKLVFNIEGLLTEYMDQATIVRGGEIVHVDTLEELETLNIEGLGEMEAFVTSGGTSTAPHTFKSRVPSYEYKTIRYPGHCERMKIFKTFGFWGREPVKTRGGEVTPIELFHRLMGEALRDPNDKDMVVVRGVGIGQKDGKRTTMQIDILEKHDDATGFTAMERTTGSSTAIYAAEIAAGGMASGCLKYETAMTGKRFVEELQKRGIKLAFS